MSDLYALFWQNSRLNQATMPAFAARLAAFEQAAPPRNPLHYPAAGTILDTPRDELATLMEQRHSSCRFSPRPLGMRQAGHVFASLRQNRRGTRTFASAGALYAVEAFAFLLNVRGPLQGHAAWYDAARHVLVPIAPAPTWQELAPLVNLGVEGPPHLLVLLMLRPQSMLEKYGERGGRFALIEVGLAAQNLALRVARERLVGCAAGGCWDDAMLRHLGLSPAEWQPGLGYACGLPRSNGQEVS